MTLTLPKFDSEWCKFRFIRNLYIIPSDTSRLEELSRILQQKSRVSQCWLPVDCKLHSLTNPGLSQTAAWFAPNQHTFHFEPLHLFLLMSPGPPGKTVTMMASFL